MTDNLKKTTVNGVIWSSIERLSGQVVGFIVIVIMSRLLNQTDYGLVGMLMIFIDIAQCLVDSGVTQALIRKLDRSEEDCSTAFFFNLGLSILFYIILFFCAPLIARFYNQPELTSLTRVISLSIILNAFMMVQKSLFTVKIDFKTQTKASLTAAIVSGLLGIWFAFNGFGVWAIVFYQLINLFITGVLLWVLSSWRPRLLFSWESFKYFFRFGSNLTIAGVMHTIYKDMYLVVIGKFYKPAAVGFYTRAHQFGALPSYNVSNILQRVTYPILCSHQNDAEKLGMTFNKFLRLISFIVLPMMTGLAMVATPLVRILLGDSWIFTGVLLTILCFAMMWMPMDSLNLSLLQVRGRTDYFLKCEVWKKVFGVSILFATIPFGLEIICWGQVIRALLDLVIDTYYSKKFLNLGLLKQLRQILPTIICCAIMAAVIWISMKFLPIDWLKLIVGVSCGIVSYFAFATIFARNELNEIKVFLKRKTEQE